MTEPRSLRQRQRFWFWFWILLPIGFLNLVEFVPLGMIRGIGSQQIVVRIQSPNGMPTACRTYAAYSRQEAQLALAEFSLYAQFGTRQTGKRFTLLVTTTRSASPILMRSLSHTEPNWLAIVAEWPDGRKEGKVVEIPRDDAMREVTVEFP
jgi:hypothetical protein